MSQHDLPVWARVLSLPLMIGATWYVERLDTVVGLVGESLPLVTVGVVGATMILGMRAPLNLWPPGPSRRKFSLNLGFLPGIVLSVLILLSIGTDAPRMATEFDRGALVLTVIGGASWAVAVAMTEQLHYLKWYGAAVLVAIVPELLAYVATPRLGLAQSSAFEFGAYAFFAGTAISGFLVTQELAFRRVIVGDPARAGVLALLGSAGAYGLWHAAAVPGAGPWLLHVTAGMATGLAGGALFVLSESLLVSAVYFGLHWAAERTFFWGDGAVESGQVPPEMTWTAILLTLVAGCVMGWLVYRKNGWSLHAVHGATSAVPRAATGNMAVEPNIGHGTSDAACD